jgi:hypothetical protein
VEVPVKTAPGTSPVTDATERTASLAGRTSLGHAALLEALLKLVAIEVTPLVRAALDAQANDDPWLDHCLWPFTRRTSLRLARAGTIEGVRRSGRKYFARRSAIDAYLEGQPAPATPTADEPDHRAQEPDSGAGAALLALWGLEASPGATAARSAPRRRRGA